MPNGKPDSAGLNLQNFSPKKMLILRLLTDIIFICSSRFYIKCQLRYFRRTKLRTLFAHFSAIIKMFIYLWRRRRASTKKEMFC